DNQSGFGPCDPGKLVTGIDEEGHVICTTPGSAVLGTAAAGCYLYFGWVDKCSGCSDPPSKWSRTSAAACDNGVGSKDTCTTEALGSDTVQLFGLSADGNVDDNDKFFAGMHCLDPEKKGGAVMGACPAGQFVVGTHADATIECASPAPEVVTYLKDHWSVY